MSSSRQTSTALRADETSAPRLAPPLKWAGGKRWQVPRLHPLWRDHSHRRLVEPFCGGLSVALGLDPARALLNDINPHVINLYRWLQRGLPAPVPQENEKDAFYRHRARFNELIVSGCAEDAEAAALFIYLNRTCFNGLCRFNAKGLFNVPFGRYVTTRLGRDLGPFREAFSTWTFMHGDFEAVPLDPEDFVYADPPYDVPFTQYAKGGFGWTDQQRTARWLAGHPGPVVLVNQATERILALYEELGYDIELLDAPRRISCTGDRTPAREVLARRNLD